MSDILVVDDDAIARLSIASTLNAAGFKVTTAEDGNTALELVKSQRYQLILSDWSMPQMNGLELCRAVRSENFSGYVYFILLTSNDGPEDTLEGLGAGADDYIVKPFHPGELIMRVNTGRRIVGLETRDVAIFSMAKLAESRDPETGAHLERVRNYSRVLAEYVRSYGEGKSAVNDEFVRLIFETSPLHDVGKVAIPDSILLKPEKLTDEEFAIMQTHTLRGADILSAAIGEFPHATFLQMAHDIALYHHERYDGTGYPNGLQGQEIPLCARIVSLADVYDALTSKRVYKDAISHEESKELIVSEAGKHFDPLMVQAFVAREQEFREIHSFHHDNAEHAGIESSSDSSHNLRSMLESVRQGHARVPRFKCSTGQKESVGR